MQTLKRAVANGDGDAFHHHSLVQIDRSDWFVSGRAPFVRTGYWLVFITLSFRDIRHAPARENTATPGALPTGAMPTGQLMYVDAFLFSSGTLYPSRVAVESGGCR